VNTALWWTNVAAWSAQVAVLTAAGALLPWAFRVRLPRARLLSYQAVLAVCLLWPVVQPWRRTVVFYGHPASVARTEAQGQVPVQTRTGPIPWQDFAIAVLGAGAAIRILWLRLGLGRLRRYRLEAELLDPVPEPVDDARLLVGAEADVFLSSLVGSPVTFGFLRPAVLLPAQFHDLTGQQQYAVACHEFLHVRRHDWLITLGEEVVGALLWFHPAVWWLLSRIRLTREQVVDREVVQLTRAGQPYVDALLTLAGACPQLDLAPAPLLLRKRHLVERLRSLLKEVSMSKSRLISSYALMSLLLAVVGWGAFFSFPLRAAPEIKEGPAGRAESSPVEQNSEAGAAAGTATKVPLKARRTKPTASGEVVPSVFENFDCSALPRPLRELLQRRLSGYAKKRLAAGEMKEIVRIVSEADPNIYMAMHWGTDPKQMTLVLTLGERPQRHSEDEKHFMDISFDDQPQPPLLRERKEPVYPPEAKAAGIQGTVLLTAVIDTEGHPRDLKVQSGHPLLIPAAMAAVRQWVYRPTTRNGKPVEVSTPIIEVNFSLPESR
jgi:TonB family protein